MELFENTFLPLLKLYIENPYTPGENPSKSDRAGIQTFDNRYIPILMPEVKPKSRDKEVIKMWAMEVITRLAGLAAFCLALDLTELMEFCTKFANNILVRNFDSDTIEVLKEMCTNQYPVSDSGEDSGEDSGMDIKRYEPRGEEPGAVRRYDTNLSGTQTKGGRGENQSSYRPEPQQSNVQRPTTSSEQKH